ncbi:MAG: MlaD family protein [Muribaculaceae bacterium]|nr:MlaD family protein [Muribaculaceae bacterium]
MNIKFNKEFKIGLSVIVAIAVLIFGIDYLKGINLFTPSNYYIAEYDNVAGLEVSAPVTIDGFKVGQVRELNFNYEKPGKIQVVLALDKHLNVPEDTYAQLASSLLSGASVELKMGHSTKMLEKGSVIKTRGVSDIMDALANDLMPQVNSILPKIDSLLYNLNMLVADPALAASIGRLDGITGNLLATSQGLSTTMNREVPGIMSNARHISTTLDTVAGNLGTLSYQLRTLPLNATMDNVRDITANLEKFSQSLNNQNSSLSKLTSDPELYNRLNRVAADVDSLIVDIKKNPKRYISIKLL